LLSVMTDMTVDLDKAVFLEACFGWA